MKLQTVRDLFIQSLTEWQEDKASRLAAALSYYTIFSMPPLLIITLAIAGRFYDREAAQDQILAQASSLVGQSAPASTYGAAGSLIVLLLWVYYSAQILFFGAEFTQVYANRFGDKIVPNEKAISTDASTSTQNKLA